MSNNKPTSEMQRDSDRAARYFEAARLIEKWATEDPEYNEAVCSALDQLDLELEKESRLRQEGRDESAA